MFYVRASFTHIAVYIRLACCTVLVHNQNQKGVPSLPTHSQPGPTFPFRCCGNCGQRHSKTLCRDTLRVLREQRSVPARTCEHPLKFSRNPPLLPHVKHHTLHVPNRVDRCLARTHTAFPPSISICCCCCGCGCFLQLLACRHEISFCLGVAHCQLVSPCRWLV